jgi:hypothetical protein
MKAQQKAIIHGFLLRSEMPLSDIRRLQDSESILAKLDSRASLSFKTGRTSAVGRDIGDY